MSVPASKHPVSVRLLKYATQMFLSFLFLFSTEAIYELNAECKQWRHISHTIVTPARSYILISLALLLLYVENTSCQLIIRLN